MNRTLVCLLLAVFGHLQIFPSALLAGQESSLQQTIQENERAIRELLENKFEKCLSLAQLYEKDNQLEKAVKYYEIARSIKEQDLSTNNKLAELYYKLGRYERALSQYKKVLELQSGNKTHIYDKLGNCYKNLGRIDEAKETWKKIVESAPTSEHSYTRTASIYKENKMYDEAVEVYKKAIEQFPNSYRLHTNLAETYASQDKYELAVVECKRALTKAKTDKKEWLTDRLVDYSKKAGLLDELIEDKKVELDKLNQELLSAYLKMGEFYEKNRQYQKAIATYEKVLVLNITAKENQIIQKKIESLTQKVEQK